MIVGCVFITFCLIIVLKTCCITEKGSDFLFLGGESIILNPKKFL